MTHERERARFDFLVARDGRASASAWMEDLIRTYRKVVLGMRRPGGTHTMYRRQYIASYRSAKRLLRNERPYFACIDCGVECEDNECPVCHTGPWCAACH